MSQLVAPQVPVVVQAAEQQRPVPVVPQTPDVHSPAEVQLAPFAKRPESLASVALPESTLESMCEPVSALEESTLEESVLEESVELESWPEPESPTLESPPELESPPVSGAVLSVPMLSPSGPSPMVTSSRPPSWGILLRSKSTSSSQPAASIAPHVTAAVTRPHLIERFVFIDVFPEQP